jgi:hypothetical protein
MENIIEFCSGFMCMTDTNQNEVCSEIVIVVPGDIIFIRYAVSNFEHKVCVGHGQI